MLFLQNKKFSFSILFLLLLLTFQPLSSSQQLKKNVEFNTSKKDHSQKVSYCSSYCFIFIFEMNIIAEKEGLECIAESDYWLIMAAD